MWLGIADDCVDLQCLSPNREKTPSKWDLDWIVSQSVSVPRGSRGPGVILHYRGLQRAQWGEGGEACSALQGICVSDTSELQENCFASLRTCAPFPISLSLGSDGCLRWPTGALHCGPTTSKQQLPLPLSPGSLVFGHRGLLGVGLTNLTCFHLTGVLPICCVWRAFPQISSSGPHHLQALVQCHRHTLPSSGTFISSP